MKIIEKAMGGVTLLQPEVHEDCRGSFHESFNLSWFHQNVDKSAQFVQDNQSTSLPGVLRGLHYQLQRPQGKLIRVLQGIIYDVAVDIRTDSKDRGRWAGFILGAAAERQLWIPPGFAHGFYVLTGPAVVQYKTTDFYDPENAHTIRWDDPDLGIQWPIDENMPLIQSEGDQKGGNFRDAPLN